MGRNNYYGNNYSPHLYLDGTIDAGYNTGVWETRINSEMNSASPLDMQINGEYEPSTRTGHVDLRIIATASINFSNLKVRIGVIESNIFRSSPNGTAVHNQTFRDMTPGTSGIAITIAEGDTVDLTQNFSCPSPLVERNSEIVVFVQSDSGHRILQGARRSVMSLSYFLNPFSLILPLSLDTLDFCNPNFVWHPSHDADSGYAVDYQVFVDSLSNFSGPIVVSGPLPDTSYECPICLPNNNTYYWKVVASNGHAPDRESNEVFVFTVQEPPSGCQYVVGDANANGSFNGIDVSYSVSYFKGGNPPPYSCDCGGSIWYVAGDVNGNCQFNGIDVSYMVSYFKGGPAPTPCPQCPPGRR